MILTLYAKPDCPLCEEARELIAQLHVPVIVQEVDISRDAQLLDRYGIRIPVLSRPDALEDLDWPFGLVEIVDWLVH